MGSPPHVWGKLISKRWITANTRITPTCVGKAEAFDSFCLQAWDHPHMCGESCLTHTSFDESTGSPPHVWGKPYASDITVTTKGITPTCVGKAKACDAI